jgi:hypothetical protein
LRYWGERIKDLADCGVKPSVGDKGRPVHWDPEYLPLVDTGGVLPSVELVEAVPDEPYSLQDPVDEELAEV